MGSGRTRRETTTVRRHPKRRARIAASGEASATAMVGALTVSAASAFDTPNTASSMGRSGIDA